MKKFSRKILTFLLVVAIFVPMLLLLGGCPVTYRDDDIYYTIYSDHAEVNCFVGKGNGGFVCEVPSEVVYDDKVYPVTGVCYDGSPFVIGGGYAIEIILPETVTTFTYEEYCNYGYSSSNDFQLLQKITVHQDNEVYADVEGVLFTKDKTELLFYPCAREDYDFTLPKETTTIGYTSMLRQNTLLRVIFVEEGSGAFGSVDGILYTADLEELMYYPLNRQFETFTVPKDMQTINPNSMLYSNEYVRNIEVDSSNVYLKVIDNVLYSYDGSELVYRPANKDVRYFVIPDTVSVVSYNALPQVDYLFVPKSVTLFLDYFVDDAYTLKYVDFIYFEGDVLPNYVTKDYFKGELHFGITLEEFEEILQQIEEGI